MSSYCEYVICMCMREYVRVNHFISYQWICVGDCVVCGQVIKMT